MAGSKKDEHPLKEALNDIEATKEKEMPAEKVTKRPTVAMVNSKVDILLASVDQIQIDVARTNEMVKASIMYFAEKEIPDPEPRDDNTMFG